MCSSFFFLMLKEKVGIKSHCLGDRKPGEVHLVKVSWNAVLRRAPSVGGHGISQAPVLCFAFSRSTPEGTILLSHFHTPLMGTACYGRDDPGNVIIPPQGFSTFEDWIIVCAVNVREDKTVCAGPVQRPAYASSTSALRRPGASPQITKRPGSDRSTLH